MKLEAKFFQYEKINFAQNFLRPSAIYDFCLVTTSQISLNKFVQFLMFLWLHFQIGKIFVNKNAIKRQK